MPADGHRAQDWEPSVDPGDLNRDRPPNELDGTPRLVVISDDFFLIPRLEDAGRRLGYRVVVVDRPEVLGAEGEPAPRAIPLTEPLEGADAVFIRQVRELHPALIIFDLASGQLPWERWIQTLKTSAATRRIPILAFGPHVETGALERAKRAGSDHVVTRGRLQASLPELIQRHARPQDLAGLRAACKGRPSALAQQGIELHNAGEYFEAHEALELAWMEAEEAEGYLYRALLQVTVAYLHIQRGNRPGAQKMLLRVRQWLDPLPEVCRGIDLQRIKTNLGKISAALESEDLQTFDRSLFEPFQQVG